MMIKEKTDIKEEKDNETEEKGMDKSDDVLRKMSHAYLGEPTHEYFGLPGTFKHKIENEFPDKDGKQKRTDGSYIVEENGKPMIINIEDESSVVNENTLAKSYGYCVNMQFAYKLPVYSAITTSIPLDKCTKIYCPSETLKYLPKIISFKDFDGNERLEYARSKLDKNETFSAIETYDLINIPKMFDEGNDEILEEVCDIFSKINVETPEEKFRLSKCLECVINTYGKTIDDINRLKEVINMVEVSEETRQIVRDVYKNEIEEAKEKARLEEREKVRLEERETHKKEKVALARKFSEEIGIDKASKITGLSKEQILNK